MYPLNGAPLAKVIAWLYRKKRETSEIPNKHVLHRTYIQTPGFWKVAFTCRSIVTSFPAVNRQHLSWVPQERF